VLLKTIVVVVGLRVDDHRAPSEDRSDPRRSIVVIAHRLETITGVDTILVLSDGRVVERGDHQQLLAAGGRYAALWNAQHASALEPR
jgi:ABC-type multidrug transport system fused ATPase/permease subunit